MSVTVGSRDRRTLLKLGALLLAAAALSWCVAALSQLDGYDWPDDALVVADGQPHEVAVDPDRSAVVWTFEWLAEPTCSLEDAENGAVLPVERPANSYRREGGSAGDWVSTATVSPMSDALFVTCEPLVGADPPIPVVVEAAPVLPPALDGLGPWGIGALALATSGLLALLGAVVRRR